MHTYSKVLRTNLHANFCVEPLLPPLLSITSSDYTAVLIISTSIMDYRAIRGTVRKNTRPLTVTRHQGPKLLCLLKVKYYLSLVLIFQHDILNVYAIARLGAVHMVRNVVVIYRIHKTILILRSLKSYFSYLKYQYLTKVVLTSNFKEAL